MTVKTSPDRHVETLSLEEGTKMFDERARERLANSGEEFIRRFQDGELGELDDLHHSEVFSLTLLMPFAGYGLDGRRQS